MTNDERPNDEGIPDDEDHRRMSQAQRREKRRQSCFVIVSSLGLSSFVICIMWLWPHDRITIGVEGRKVASIAGPRLSAIPYTHGDPLAVRIADVEPTPDGFRYDLRYMAYGPGQHDLRDYLLNERQQPPSGLPSMKVSIGALLAEEEGGTLQETPPAPINLHTNYRLQMGMLWCVWGMSLLPLLFWGRKRRSHVVPTPQPTVPERLRSLLELATHSPLTVEQQTDVEKLLLTFWAERLRLPRERLAETLDELRKHPSAGEQVSRVERWLHSRDAHGNGSVARELLASLGSVI